MEVVSKDEIDAYTHFLALWQRTERMKSTNLKLLRKSRVDES